MRILEKVLEITWALINGLTHGVMILFIFGLIVICCRGIIDGVQHIDKHGVKSVIERIWEGDK